MKKKKVSTQKHKTHKIRADNAKLRELILLIARRSETDLKFGAIKLNKLLFYADFLAYVKLGKPITGTDYFALPQGPAPRWMLPIKHAMEQAGEIAIRKSETYSGVMERTLALREPNLRKFTVNEVDLVHWVIQQCWRMSGKDLSDMMHRFCGWRLANEKETIPYAVALVGEKEPTHDEVKRGLELEASAAACLARYAVANA